MTNCNCENDNNFLKSNLTMFDIRPSKTKEHEKQKSNVFLRKLLQVPSVSELRQYIGVALCGLTLWSTSWFVFKDAVLPGGFVFQMAGVVLAGYSVGHTLERYTTINPVVGMTVIGALYRNFGPPNFLENPVADVIDFHLRRIYPVIILTKGPLGWNRDYIKNNSVKVFTLATLPWIVECLATTFFTHILLDYPWYWGLHLGSILASVSPAIVVPTAMALHSRGFGVEKQIALLVGNAGGLDTAFTEGMFGVINSAIFYPASITYRIIKGILAIFVGIAVGIVWGVVCDYIPAHNDYYAPTIRSILIFGGGFLLTYAGGFLGWGGVSGVAIMVCAGTAATRWSRRDWPINNNPVSEVYKLLWRIFEPMLFTLSGYFLEVSQITLVEFGLIIACIIAALVLRLLAAVLVALANDMSVKESLFIAVTWMPKAIVEAVLVRVATDSLWADATSQDRRIASQHANIIVIAIILTSTLGSALTTILGPILLSQESRIGPEEIYNTQTLSSQSTHRRTTTPTSIPNNNIKQCWENDNNDSESKISKNSENNHEKHWDIAEDLPEERHDKNATAVEKGVYIIHSEEEIRTTPDEGSNSDGNKEKEPNSDSVFEKIKVWFSDGKSTIFHYVALALLGLITWGLVYLSCGDDFGWSGPYFRLCVVAVTAWASGLVLLAITGFPPLLAALLTGILARNLGYLDMRQFTSIDMFLRAIYPVIILGKGSLGWDISFMKANWRSIVPLGVVPWTSEVLTLATCMYLLFGHPYIWGLMFGAFYASASFPVVMQTVAECGSDPKRSRAWPQIVANAGGLDTTLSVGMFGVFYSLAFSPADETYRYIRAALTIFVGVGIGAVWGCIAGVLPHKKDFYVTELRVLLVVIGGLFFNFFVIKVGWAGAAGVGVLVCNAVAAKFWSSEGWQLNKNPASTAYRVIWSTCEPVLFAYTGTFFEITGAMSHHFFYGLLMLAICLTVRLGAASLMCFGMSRRERLFICLCWSPKTIVEAVLCPLPMNTLIMNGGTEQEIKYAEDILRLTIHAILFTTPFVFPLIRLYGPSLLKTRQRGSGL